jgi:hypothetical protein
MKQSNNNRVVDGQPTKHRKKTGDYIIKKYDLRKVVPIQNPKLSVDVNLDFLQDLIDTGYIVNIFKYEKMISNDTELTAEEIEEANKIDLNERCPAGRTKNPIRKYYEKLLSNKSLEDCTLSELAFPTLMYYLSLHKKNVAPNFNFDSLLVDMKAYIVRNEPKNIKQVITNIMNINKSWMITYDPNPKSEE